MRTSTAIPRHNGQSWTGCCIISPWSMHRWCWEGRWGTTCRWDVTMAGWRTEPQKTRGKIANRAARVFLATSCQAALHGVHSSVRFHFSEIQSYYSLFLQVPTFTSHLSTHEECTPVRFWFAVYSRSAGFILASFARLRVFSVNSAQTMPSQRIFSVNPGKSAYFQRKFKKSA